MPEKGNYFKAAAKLLCHLFLCSSQTLCSPCSLCPSSHDKWNEFTQKQVVKKYLWLSTFWSKPIRKHDNLQQKKSREPQLAPPSCQEVVERSIKQFLFLWTQAITIFLLNLHQFGKKISYRLRYLWNKSLTLPVQETLSFPHVEAQKIPPHAADTPSLHMGRVMPQEQNPPVCRDVVFCTVW